MMFDIFIVVGLVIIFTSLLLLLFDVVDTDYFSKDENDW